MCGITAISRAIGRSSISNPRQFMRLAALAIEPRGRDATGFAWVREDGSSFYWKTPDRAQNAASIAPLDKDIVTAIGHTRWKTQGDQKDNRNNHPVIDDGIMLVHNGCITNDYALYKLLGADYVKKAQVDSQVIATMLANMPAFDADHPVDLLEVLEGSAALAWIQTGNTDVLHLARVQERPLTIGWTRLGDLVMSSTPDSLFNLATWSNTKIRDFWEVDEGTYLTVEAGQVTDMIKFKPKRRTYTGYTSTSPGAVQRSGSLLSYEQPTTKGSNKGAEVLPFVDPAETDYESWLDEQAWWEAQELAGRLAETDVDADDEPTRPGIALVQTQQDRYVDDNGMQWIPIWDGDEVTDYVILDENGKFVCLAGSDNFEVAYAVSSTDAPKQGELSLPRGS